MYNKQKRYNFTLDEETADKLKELADNAHTNMSQWISDRVWEMASVAEDTKKAQKSDGLKKTKK